MIHTASLVHDDVIDASNLRRGKHTAHFLWGQRKVNQNNNNDDDDDIDVLL